MFTVTRGHGVRERIEQYKQDGYPKSHTLQAIAIEGRKPLRVTYRLRETWGFRFCRTNHARTLQARYRGVSALPSSMSSPEDQTKLFRFRYK
jgi:hypothetical protein